MPKADREEARAAYKRAWEKANKETIRAKRKAYYEANKARLRIKMDKYASEHKSEKKEYDRRRRLKKINELRAYDRQRWTSRKVEKSWYDRNYYIENKDRVRAANKKWYYGNREEVREHGKEYREANKERIRANSASYRLSNRKKITAQQAAWNKRKRATDPAFALRSRISCRLRSMLHNKAGRKTEDILGYTMQELKTHIERQFTSGMSWEKLLTGEIHIDHIKPVSSFNITDVDDPNFKKCWGLQNLQPLWAKDNAEKSNKPYEEWLRTKEMKKCA